MKTNDEETLMDKLRSLFPAIEIKVEHVCHDDRFNHTSSLLIFLGTIISWA